MDGVDLQFEEGALRAIAQKAIEQNTGARGLRSIMEGVLGSLMYHTPSDHTIDTITVTEACITEGAEPMITHDPDKKPVKLQFKMRGRGTEKFYRLTITDQFKAADGNDSSAAVFCLSNEGNDKRNDILIVAIRHEESSWNGP